MRGRRIPIPLPRYKAGTIATTLNTCPALNLGPFFPKFPAIDHFNRMCAAMDFNSIAMPIRLANGEIHNHACIHHSLANFLGHA
ncbi:hypothetical protein GGI59_006007 [Rhizobium lentis]|uniref:Uncharacterized protein n=1 Tax=Rhizobium lentis TaxID=1138194 RepID=A0A7W9CY82_9HYPH|nr:hypothetical protein [Rhizobium lentis]MBB5553730.1 hypothetical protein [Rhizobium lentis]MBB5564299.1 hypothetical protein [Rhizobium lentis]MBB5570776.1 hypothetical protein [Rhizobium lentis]